MDSEMPTLELDTCMDLTSAKHSFFNPDKMSHAKSQESWQEENHWNLKK